MLYLTFEFGAQENIENKKLISKPLKILQYFEHDKD